MPDIDQGRGETAKAAALVVKQALGVRRVRLVPEPTGLSNVVFTAHTPKGRFIVRLSGVQERIDAFEREREVIARVRDIGVPVVEVVAVGIADRFAFMLSRHVPGEPALHHPRRNDVLIELGRLAGRIHTLRTVGYGPAFSWPDVAEAPPVSWKSWLADDIKAAGRLEMLRQRELITPRQFDTLTRTLADVEQWDQLPVLQHGDLRLKNVLVNAEGAVQAVLDWEDCISCVGPHWDISVALHDLSIDAKEAFLSGYGMSFAAMREAAPVWRLFNALNYVPTVVDQIPPEDEAALERVRIRLSGALDLYAA